MINQAYATASVACRSRRSHRRTDATDAPTHDAPSVALPAGLRRSTGAQAPRRQYVVDDAVAGAFAPFSANVTLQAFDAVVLERKGACSARA